MQDHLQARVVYASNVSTLNNEVNNTFLKARIGLQYIFKRSGPMAMDVSLVCIFARTSAELIRPDIQFHIQPISTDAPSKGLHRYAAFTASVCQLRHESRGWLKLTSPDPHTQPAIYPNYLATETDKQVIVDGVKLSRRIAATSPPSGFVKSELVPGPQVQTDAQLLDAIRNTSTYLPVGTCKMGIYDMSVVDARLRVRDIRSLRVADASIMPSFPQATPTLLPSWSAKKPPT